jgi:hypothetical protein
MTELKDKLKEAFLTEYRDVISYILSATEHDVNNEKMRNWVSGNLRRAIRMSKGNMDMPQQTKLYKAAMLLHDCKSLGEFQLRLEKSIKIPFDRWLAGHDINWKATHFDLRPQPKTEAQQFMTSQQLDIRIKTLLDAYIGKNLQDIRDDIRDINADLRKTKERDPEMLNDLVSDLREILISHKHDNNGVAMIPVSFLQEDKNA